MEVNLVYAHLEEDVQVARPLALVGYFDTHLYPPTNHIYFSLYDTQVQVLDITKSTTFTYIFGRILYSEGVWQCWHAIHPVEYSTYYFILSHFLGRKSRWILDSSVIKAKVVSFLQRLDLSPHPRHYN